MVDVFLEDVAEHVWVDLVVVSAGGVVEVPGVALEEGEEVFEGFVGDADLCVIHLDAMWKKEAAVEKLDLAEKFLCGSTAFFLGFRKAFEEKRIEEARVVAVAT